MAVVLWRSPGRRSGWTPGYPEKRAAASICRGPSAHQEGCADRRVMVRAGRFDERYELGDRLGRGGMAEVYQARDLLLDRLVAVKVMRADLADDDAARARFRREARLAAGLTHRSIIAVHDTGEARLRAAVVPFLVMEYVDGPTLAEQLVLDPPAIGR